MSRDHYRSLREPDGSPILFVLLVIGALFVGGFFFGWYQAGMQARMYARQGIQITQWEVFIGVEPAERVVQIREERSP